MNAIVLKLEGAITEDRARELAIECSALNSSLSHATLVLDSGGGDYRTIRPIVAALRRAEHMGCRVEILAKRAEGVAACILAASDRAHLMPGAILRFEGACVRPSRTFRREHALLLALGFDRANRGAAKLVAKCAALRLARRVCETGTAAHGVFTGAGEYVLEHVSSVLRTHVRSADALRVVSESIARCALIRDVLSAIRSWDPGEPLEVRRLAEIGMFQRVVGAEIQVPPRRQRRINAITTAECVMDYVLAHDLWSSLRRAPLAEIATELFPGSNHSERPSLGNNERPSAAATSIWLFAAVLVHCLLAGSKRLSGDDAYWLGLIDSRS